MAKHNEVGLWGEEVACNYLIEKGYAIVGRNQKVGRVELDIIAMKGNGIMFVEVKTRSSNLLDPLDAITTDKVRRLCRAAHNYIRSMNIPHRPQIDIIAIVGTPEKYELQHYPDAFIPPFYAR